MICDEIGLSDRIVAFLAFQRQYLDVLQFLRFYSHLLYLAPMTWNTSCFQFVAASFQYRSFTACLNVRARQTFHIPRAFVEKARITN